MNLENYITRAYRELDGLEKNFRRKVDFWLDEVEENKIKIFVTETLRGDKRQQYLKSQGFSKINRSLHQDGKAIDIAFDPSTYGTLYPQDHSLWKKVADIANKYEIDWGYDLWKWDKPHFQENGQQLDLYSNVPEWAEDAINWYVENNIISKPEELKDEEIKILVIQYRTFKHLKLI